MSKLSAFSLKEWIDEHRHLLKPPVGNQVVWKDTDFIVMIVGGPNLRKDYHINETEEFFHQLEGDMVLRIKEEAKRRRVTVDERGHRALLLVQPCERLVPLAGDRLQLIVDAQLPLLLRLADALERFRLGRALVRRARARVRLRV